MFGRKRRIPSARLIILLFAVALFMNGCPFRQAQEPGGGGEEPIISVFFHQAKEIKKMKLEDYLAGVVAGEMEADFPVQAMAAQAIIARTFTLKEITEGRKKFRGADVSTDPQEFQAYNADNIRDKVIEAIKMTRGEVISYQGGLAEAFFHSCSGGRTATAPEGLEFNEEATPYLKSIDDFECERKQNWQASFSTDEIRQAATQIGRDPGEINSISIGRKGPSGRAVTLLINGTQVSAPSFRVAIGPEKMRSTFLEKIEMEGGEVSMAGKGFGHGVGMSQFGAKMLAERGKTPEEIIEFYYKGVSIEKRWR